MPRSKRNDESLNSERVRAVFRTESGANSAVSMSTLQVEAEISVAAPPITPPSATGFSASAITHMPGARV